MKTFALTVLLIIAIFTTAFIRKNESPDKESYIITGSVKGYPDSTKLYLDDISTDNSNTIDSTVIIRDQFKFSGTMSGNILHAIIHTKRFSDYKFFWIENNPMTFTAEKGKFHFAIITGSKAQEKDDELNAAINLINQKSDSLNHLINKNISEGTKKEIAKQIALIRDEELAANAAFIKANPTSIVSAYILSVYSSTFGKDKTTTLYNNFSPENKKSIYGKNILHFITLNRNLKVGDHYVDFSQKTSQGKEIKISDYAGKIILIDFWASWCGPCRNENPELVKTYNEYKNKGLVIIGVSLDRDVEKQEWMDAIEKDGLTWPNISELKGDKNTAALIYGISGIPDNFLIDRSGIIIARNLRGQDLRDKLKEILK